MSKSAKDLIRVAPKYLGVPYSELDCQAFVEACLKDIGIDKNLPGSNAWYRTMTWVGSPEECKRYFGKIPVGAFLFILKHDDMEPEKYKSDGIGNASHIGIYTGMTGKEMLKDCPAYMELEHTSQRNAFEKKVQFGNGAVHSSSSRGCVCTSSFAGKAINGGWNRIGLWDRISYGDDVDKALRGKETPGNGIQEGDAGMTATVYAPSGSTVNLRAKPTTAAALVERVPVGTQVTIISESGDWAYIQVGDEDHGLCGYMMSEYLRQDQLPPGETQQETVMVDRAWLKKVYQTIGEYLGSQGVI